MASVTAVKLKCDCGFFSVLCCCSVSLQVIQTIRAMDRDNFANGRFSFALPADVRANPNFTLKDNEGMKVRNQSSQFTKNMDSQLDHTFS